LAAKTQAKIPTLNGRVEKACKLVLAGDVALHDDGTATVASLSQPSVTYRLRNGACQCKDYAHAPEHLCCHRIAVGFVRKVNELLPPTAVDNVRPTEPVAPLPEAPASVNCHITLEGRQVQITLRDTDETRLLQRLTALLKQYPAPEPPERQKGWCALHQVPMTQTTKDGRSWWSHKTAVGWCKGK
jgi:hypothetical protein